MVLGIELTLPSTNSLVKKSDYILKISEIGSNQARKYELWNLNNCAKKMDWLIMKKKNEMPCLTDWAKKNTKALAIQLK